jgi:hypothetical protein
VPPVAPRAGSESVGERVVMGRWFGWCSRGEGGKAGKGFTKPRKQNSTQLRTEHQINPSECQETPLHRLSNFAIWHGRLSFEEFIKHRFLNTFGLDHSTFK